MKSEDRDPVELFGRLDWPTGGQPVDIERDEVAASILKRVLDGEGVVVSIDRTARRRRIGILIAATAVFGAAGSVAAAVLFRSEPEDSRSVACWSTPVNPPLEQRVIEWDGRTDPATLCGGTGPSSQATGGDSGVLTACVTDGGITAVIPGPPTICADLGLATFARPGESTETQTVAEADRFFGSTLNAETCRTLSDATALVRKELDEIGLERWTIKAIGQFGPNETCATVALDRSTRTAYIASVPPSP